MIYLLNFIYPAPSAPPQNVRVEVLNSTAISLQWAPPPEHFHNGLIRKYKMHFFENESSSQLEVFSTELMATIHNLHPAYTYLCKVAAVTVSVGMYSEVVIISTPMSGNYK